MEKKTTKIFFLDTKGGCNNYCLGCAAPLLGNKKDGLPLSFLIKEMDKAKELGYEKLHLVGGEITIQNNVFELLEAGRVRFKKLFFTSNGRMFSYYNFTEKFSKIGVDHIRITLCGHTAEIHETWTRVPNSFQETVQGIKNLVYFNQPIQVNILVWKGNLQYVSEIIKLIRDLGVKNLSLFNVAPLGRAKAIYRDVSVSLTDLQEINNQVVKYLDDFANVDIEDFPQCIFSLIFFTKANVHIFDTSGCVYLDENGGLVNFSVFAAQERKIPIDSQIYSDPKMLISAIMDFKKKLPICSDCSCFDSCSGVFSEYLQLKGADFVKKEILLLRKRIFLKK